MTDETTQDTPEEGSAGIPLGALLAAAMPAPNGLPLTAQGVSSLLEASRAHVEKHARAEFDTIENREGVEIPVFFKADGSVEYIPLATIDKYAGKPTFRSGAANLTTLDSFIAHVNRFGDGDSAVFVNDDSDNPSLTAVLNYHRADIDIGEDRAHGEYRSGNHRSLFNFPLSEEWQKWTGLDGQPMDMSTFATFIEDRIGDIALVEDGVPESAERFVETNGGAGSIASYGQLYELSRGLSVSEGHFAEQAINQSNGSGKLSFTTVIEGTKVNGVDVVVPTMFFIAIPVFHKGAYYRIPARLRYRVAGGKPMFWFDLWRADYSFDHAIAEAAQKVDAETSAQVFFGAPEV